MRTTILLLALLLAGCGDAVPARVDLPRDCGGKPSPPIGDVEVVIVERIAPDRVVLEARWGRGRDQVEGQVDLLLPEGAWIIEGPGREIRAAKGRDGVARWTVEHRRGEALDAVVRLRRDTQGHARAREACVRLAAPDDV